MFVRSSQGLQREFSQVDHSLPPIKLSRILKHWAIRVGTVTHDPSAQLRAAQTGTNQCEVRVFGPQIFWGLTRDSSSLRIIAYACRRTR